jgi:hypothetical protein
MIHRPYIGPITRQNIRRGIALLLLITAVIALVLIAAPLAPS